MTYQTFQKLIKKNHLSAEALCIYLETDRLLIENWTSGNVPISESIAEKIESLDQKITIAANRALSLVLQTKPASVSLLKYLNEEDYFQFNDDAEVFRSVKVHQGLITRVAETLNLSGITAHIVDFHRTNYLTWIRKEGFSSDRATRSAWANFQSKNLITD